MPGPGWPWLGTVVVYRGRLHADCPERPLETRAVTRQPEGHSPEWPWVPWVRGFWGGADGTTQARGP
eukprot:1799927-Pyramimonas_sp.AAC.1